MSEIRNRIVKILEESTISFMEDIEAQPDLFGGEDTYYKDGKQAVGFMDVLDFMSEIAPDLDYTGDKQTNDLYWMIYDPASSGVKIDSNKVADIESKLAKRFGEGTVIVKLANAQYAPEIKRIYVGFVDKADVEDVEENVGDIKEGAINDVMQNGEASWEGITQAADDNWGAGVEDTPDIEGATEDAASDDDSWGGASAVGGDTWGESTKLLRKGQRVRIKDTAEHFQGEEGVILVRMHSALSGTPFYTVQMDNGQPYDVLADNVEPVDLEEGWKDNLKKGVATLGVAGALAGNAMAHDPMYDGATRPFDDTNMTVQQVQQLSDEDEKATRLPDGMIQDQYGNKWTQEDWDKLMRGEDPFEDNDYPPEEVDEAVESPAVDEIRKRLANEFVNLEVTGPTYDKYDPDEPRAGKTQYYIEVPEEFYEARDLEKMLFEIERKYPDFEYEGEDFSNRFWFVINEKSEE